MAVDRSVRNRTTTRTTTPAGTRHRRVRMRQQRRMRHRVPVRPTAPTQRARAGCCACIRYSCCGRDAGQDPRDPRRAQRRTFLDRPCDCAGSCRSHQRRGRPRQFRSPGRTRLLRDRPRSEQRRGMRSKAADDPSYVAAAGGFSSAADTATPLAAAGLASVPGAAFIPATGAAAAVFNISNSVRSSSPRSARWHARCSATKAWSKGEATCPLRRPVDWSTWRSPANGCTAHPIDRHRCRRG